MVDELRHFLLIVEQRTFTEAARKAHLSQPALTASIRRLEDHFKARLLDRGRTGATPTAAGLALIPRAKAVLTALQEGERAVAEVEGLHAGEVRLGGGATVCTYYLPPILANFRAQAPGILLRLREATTAEVMAALDDGELDLGIVTHPDGEHWIDDELILVAAPETDPATAPFVTFPRGATTRDLLEVHFPDAHVVMELSGIAAVLGNVRAGIGLALVSRAAVEADLALGYLVEVPHKKTPLTRRLYLVHRGVNRLPPAAAALRKLLFERKRILPGGPRRRRTISKPNRMAPES